MGIKFKEKKGEENISHPSQIFIKSSPWVFLGKYEEEDTGGVRKPFPLQLEHIRGCSYSTPHSKNAEESTRGAKKPVFFEGIREKRRYISSYR